MTRKKIFGIAFLAWSIMLIFLSLWPSLNTVIKQDLTRFRWDYVEHFFSYFILGFLYVFWRFDRKLSILVPEFILFLIAGLIFSWLIEYIQILIPGRAFTTCDMISNMAGIICGAMINYFIIVRILLKNFFNRRSHGT